MNTPLQFLSYVIAKTSLEFGLVGISIELNCFIISNIFFNSTDATQKSKERKMELTWTICDEGNFHNSGVIFLFLFFRRPCYLF